MNATAARVYCDVITSSRLKGFGWNLLSVFYMLQEGNDEASEPRMNGVTEPEPGVSSEGAYGGISDDQF